ncbi:MAG: Rieske 2Fe-2S domain-containing protein [Thermoplasmata archaeon]
MTAFGNTVLGGTQCGLGPSSQPSFFRLLDEREVRFPPGVVRRLAAGPEPSPDEVDEAKRSTLKLAVIGGVLALAAAGAASFLRFAVPPPAGSATFPRVQLLYTDGTPVLASTYRYPSTSTDLIVFNYPLDNEPNILLNLPTSAPGGIGPNLSIVAFSAVCQHLGCIPPFISYYPPGACGNFNGGRAFIHCVCHGSTYNPAVSAPGGGAAIITGPTVSPLPQVVLIWDQASDEVFAADVIGPPVKGHSSTLIGGDVVLNPVTCEAPQVPTQQCPE